MMSEFESMVMTELSDIKELAARTEQAVLDLAGPTGRVTMLEERVKTADKRNWIRSTLLGPGAVVLHIIAKHIGWPV